MPVFHVTLHGYGTWMPDHAEGYVHWKRGTHARDGKLASQYREKQCQPAVELDEDVQRVMLDQILVGAVHQRYEPIAAATERTHLHVIIGWRDDRSCQQVRTRLKHAITQRLNETFERRSWFSKGGDLKRVRDREHLSFLRLVYLPDHPGWKWDRNDGFWRDDRRHAVPRLPDVPPSRQATEPVAAALRAAGPVRVNGLDVDAESRCKHWHSAVDVVAMWFPCCSAWWACADCHEAVADHPPGRIVEADSPAARCGACGHVMTAAAYLGLDGDACPACGHGFNPGCRLHRGRYFDLAEAAASS